MQLHNRVAPILRNLKTCEKAAEVLLGPCDVVFGFPTQHVVGGRQGV